MCTVAGRHASECRADKFRFAGSSGAPRNDYALDALLRWPVTQARLAGFLASRHDRKASILYHSADGIGMALGAVAKFLGNVIARQEAANARNPDRSIKIPQADDSGAFMRTAGLAQARLAVRPVQPVLIRHSLRYSGKRARISARYPSVPDRCFRRWRCASSGWFAPIAFTINR